jgi:single-stranded-DNA-specific exonuclease
MSSNENGNSGSLSALVTELLEKRGITTKKEEEIFLNPDYEKHLHDPFLLTDMDIAVKRILSALEGEERLTIYADFDCDGIPAAVILHDFFKKVGHDNFEVYIPHRHNEGYGFHKEAIEKIVENGTKLIITVDVGINAIDAAKFAKKIGVDVIITDHHEINGKLPDALAVINPKRDDYPFKELCGAAVAYKLVQALIFEGKRKSSSRFEHINEGWEKWLLDMVGLATVADMVPLVGENRVFIHYGLKVLRKSPRPGISSLCRKVRLEQADITEDDIGFLFAPRINAASRMDEPEIAFTLLSTGDLSEAEEATRQLDSLNRKRKGAVGAVVREARKREKERGEESLVYVTGNPNWRPALLGLVANSLSDSHGGAVCVWGRDGKGKLKGSCRSDGSVNIVDMFALSADVLEEYGGHKHAGGFSVSHENIHKLSEIFNKSADKQEKNNKNESENDDVLLQLARVSWDTLQDIAKLAPFGVGNTKPLFRFSSVTIEDVRVFGKDKNHTEIILGDTKVGGVRAFQFFITPDSFSYPPTPGSKGDVLATLERDTFNGRRAVALRVVDVCN